VGPCGLERKHCCRCSFVLCADPVITDDVQKCNEEFMQQSEVAIAASVCAYQNVNVKCEFIWRIIGTYTPNALITPSVGSGA